MAFTPVAALALGSCVAEDLSDCPPDVRVLVKTDNEMGIYDTRTGSRTTRTPVEDWYSSIETVSVYVFDENDRFVTRWIGGAHTEGVDYEVPVDQMHLAEGIYTFVAWTNLGGDYNCNMEELSAEKKEMFLDEFLMKMAVPDSRVFGKDIGHCHYGMVENVYVSYNTPTVDREYVIVVDPMIHKINVTVGGIDPAALDNTHAVKVIDRNASHDFRNRCIEGGEEYQQVRTLAPGGFDGKRAADGVKSASMHVMQVQDRTRTLLAIVDEDTGETLFEKDLVEVILTVCGEAGQAPDFFEYTLEFDIEVSFLAENRIGVEINGWYYIFTNEIIG